MTENYEFYLNIEDRQGRINRNHKLRYNLQFFADGPGGEKTEEASPKKISDARKEGQVAKSIELVSGASLITFFFVLRFLIGYLSDNLINSFPLFYKSISLLAKEEITTAIVGALINDVSLHILKIALPITGIIFALVLLINIIQVKPQITTKPLGPKLNMLSPINGFKRMFSKDKIVVLIKDILKVMLVIYIAYTTLISELTALTNLYDMGLYQGIVYI
jgi:flagellar biosynthetic protein FlhB